jgi:hypothetical protein
MAPSTITCVHRKEIVYFDINAANLGEYDHGNNWICPLSQPKIYRVTKRFHSHRFASSLWGPIGTLLGRRYSIALP